MSVSQVNSMNYSASFEYQDSKELDGEQVTTPASHNYGRRSFSNLCYAALPDSHSLRRIVDNIGKVAIPGIILYGLASIPAASAGPVAYAVCTAACMALASPIFMPACIMACLPLLTAPTP
jgi:hypothetical protein